MNRNITTIFTVFHIPSFSKNTSRQTNYSFCKCSKTIVQLSHPALFSHFFKIAMRNCNSISQPLFLATAVFICKGYCQGLTINKWLIRTGWELKPLDWSHVQRLDVAAWSMIFLYSDKWCRQIEKHHPASQILNISIKPTLMCLPPCRPSKYSIPLAPLLPKLAYLTMLFIIPLTYAASSAGH